MRINRALTSIKHRPQRAECALAHVDGPFAVIIATAMAPDLLRAIVQIGGCLSFQGRARSNSAESAMMPASSPGRPTICSASGRPDLLNPLGIEMAGWPVELNGKVNAIHP